jgi:hypothetical protein
LNSRRLSWFRGLAVAATTQQKHDEPEREHYRPPPEIYVDTERTFVDRAIAGQAKDGEHCAEDQEKKPER